MEIVLSDKSYFISQMLSVFISSDISPHETFSGAAIKYLAVLFILVVCVQNVLPDETLDFKELFRDGEKKNQTYLGINSITVGNNLIFLI